MNETTLTTFDPAGGPPMAGLIRAVALDLDGTLVDGDRLSAAAIEQVDRLRDGGLVALLVTGRIAPELDAAFPGLRGHFDAVMTERYSRRSGHSVWTARSCPTGAS